MGKKTKAVNNRQSGGIDFIRAKKKVGKTIRKNANATDTTVRAKRINLPGQTSLGGEGKGDAVTSRGLSLGELLNQTGHYSERVRKDALEGIRELLENHPGAMGGAAAAVVEKTAERLVDREQIVRIAARGALKHGVLPALGKRGIAPFAKRLVLHVGAALTHVDPLTRRDAPAALETLLDAAPELVARHAPAATLRHLADLLRRGDDAAGSALDASANASATAAAAAASAAVRATRHGLSPTFGDMTASRVGASSPNARLRLLTACRRFLETLVFGDSSSGDEDANGQPDAQNRGQRVVTTTFQTNKRPRSSEDDVFGGFDSNSSASSTHCCRQQRPPRDTATTALDAFGGGNQSRATAAERDDGAAGIPAAASDLASLLFSAWDEATPSLRDANGERGGDSQQLNFLVVVKSMTEALVSTRLALRLVDNGTHGGQLGRVPGAAAAAAAGALCHRALGGGAFPAVAPAAFGAPERRALVAYNAALVGLLSATADGVASVLDARVVERASVLSQSVVCEGLETDQETDDSDSDSDSDTDDEYFMTDTDDIISPKAGDAASTAVATYLATALRGVVLAAGPCGEAEGTGEGDYGELLRAARRALSRPTLSGQNTQIAKKALRSRNDLVQAVGEVWSAAVISGPSERRAACVSLLAAVLPNAAAAATSSSSDGSASGISAPPVAFSSAFLAEDAAAKWLRPFARALWELKHKDPNTTHRALLALRTVAARATPDRLPHTHAALVAVESELAPFFALAPPPPADPDAPRQQARLGPFSKLPRRVRVDAIALLGNLPVLSPATLRAVAHATLAPGFPGEFSGYDERDDVATRAVDAVAGNVGAAPLALTTSFFVSVLTGSPCWGRASAVAHSAGAALASLGDGDAWAGCALGWGAIATSRRRAAATGVDCEERALYGALIAVAVAAEASSFVGFVDLKPKKPPAELEGAIPEVVARALFAAASEGATPAAAAALHEATSRVLRAAPRFAAPTITALAATAAAMSAATDTDAAMDHTKATVLVHNNSFDSVAAVTATASATSRAVKAFVEVRSTKENGESAAYAEATAVAARECASILRRAADAMVTGNVPGAARAASAARETCRDVEDAFGGEE